MGEPHTEGDDTGPGPLPKEKWPTRHQAAVRLGKHVRSIDRMVQAGELHPIMYKGVKRFDPEELESCNSEGDEAHLEVQQTLQAVNDTLRTLQDFVHRLLTSVTAPAEKMLERFQSENDRLREYSGKLEARQLQAVETYEKLLSEQHARDIAARESEASAKLRAKAADLFFDLAPDIATQALGASKLSKLVTTLSDDQIEMLSQAGVMSAEQIEIIRNLRSQAANREKKYGKHDRTEDPKPVQ